jgi:hypothetical protein
MATTHNLFGSSVYKTRIDPASYDKEYIIKTMVDNYAINPVRNNWNEVSNLHHTYNDWENPDFAKIDDSSLVPVYQNVIDQFIKTVRFKSNVTYKWCISNFAINTKDMTAHDHFGDEQVHNTHNMFSCTHYISFDKSAHAPTKFINSMPLAYYPFLTKPYHTVLDDTSEQNSSYYENWSLDTEEDDFIIFPAYQKHGVFPNKRKTDVPRIVSVVNIQIIKNT